MYYLYVHRFEKQLRFLEIYTTNDPVIPQQVFWYDITVQTLSLFLLRRVARKAEQEKHTEFKSSSSSIKFSFSALSFNEITHFLIVITLRGVFLDRLSHPQIEVTFFASNNYFDRRT